ncbi:BlaI/MecI/CopY family transcriptional regulator [uncultured Algimonas sp.]|uniref:BlaI/MecI/CopY family transcriptional regulator n=1 Tax=uncultured Algimonas sp. TaxID=1547920 RepID=UPI002624161C|nr:BlaI/MecI/CopY family transcriptional regulator [uncultured Algimonas sp.]
MKASPTELVILKHLWRSGAQSTGEIHAAISERLGWSRSSSRKTIERMVEKGLLDRREVHGLNVYRARARKIPTLAGLIRAFATDVLDLDGPLPVSNLVESDLLTREELEELERVLNDAAEGEAS